MEHIIRALIKEYEEIKSGKKISKSVNSLREITFEMLNLLGAANCDSNFNLPEALKYFNIAKTFDENNWMVNSNIAHVYSLLKEYEIAEKFAEIAVNNCNNCSGDPFCNLAAIQSNLNKNNQSIENYRKAIAINSDKPIYHLNLSGELLKQGLWEEGWREYDYRIQCFPEMTKIRNRFSCPDWNGSEIDSLFIYSEQGIGDLIQFVRFLPLVKQRCKHVILEAQQEIGKLFDNFTEIDELILRSNEFLPPPKTDAVISICSLPRIFSINSNNIPIKPYINIDCGKAEKDTSKFKIGIAWAGNPSHPHDDTRSFYLNNFRNLYGNENIKLFSLQKNGSKSRIWNKKEVFLTQNTEDMKIEDLASDFNDFYDCAVAMLDLDLIITADTAIAHLAGAMGLKVFILIPFINDFRWLTEIDTSPWYPSMKLFRQDNRNDWGSAFQKINNEVVTLLK